MKENFEHKLGEPEHLKPEELKIWREMNNIFNSYHSKLSGVPFEEMNKIEERKIDFKNELEKKGIKPYDYLLFHDLIGSGVSSLNLTLDTEDHVIEKFIKELYNKYK